MAKLTLETLDQEAGAGIPHTNTLVQGARRNISVVGRDCNGGDAIIDDELKHLLVSLNIPETD